ncbi:MAG TPA: c-type cytochrome [Gaiellaceae bacterium]|nr:c-type cytochrome [Gaiellaceae bacterium]
MRRLLAFGLAALVLAPAAHAQTGDVTRGRHLYGQYCIACHGANGMGVIGGRAGGQKREGPPLVGVGALAADFYLRTGYMPLRQVGKQPRRSRVLFSDAEIRALVAYVASLGHGPPVPRPQPERGSLSEGLKLFTDHCAGCHQVVAQGGFLTGGIAPPLQDATPTQVAQAIRIGPFLMPRFSPRQITPAQVNSIVRYVEYAKHPDNRGGWAIGLIGPVPEGLVTWFLAATTLVAVCIVLGKRLGRG